MKQTWKPSIEDKETKETRDSAKKKMQLDAIKAQMRIQLRHN